MDYCIRSIINALMICTFSGYALAESTDTVRRHPEEAVECDSKEDGQCNLKYELNQYLQSVRNNNGASIDVSSGYVLMKRIYQYESVTNRTKLYNDALSVLDQIHPEDECDIESAEYLRNNIMFFLKTTKKNMERIPVQAQGVKEQFERSMLDYVELMLTFRSPDYGDVEALDLCNKLLNYDFHIYGFRSGVLRIRLQVEYWMSSHKEAFVEDQFEGALKSLLVPVTAEDQEDLGILVMELQKLQMCMQTVDDVRSERCISDFIDKNKHYQKSLTLMIKVGDGKFADQIQNRAIKPRFLRSENGGSPMK